MTEGVHGHVHIHVIHAEAVVRPSMDGEAAAESISLVINRPVHLCTQRRRQTIGGHHGAEHAELGDGAAQLLGGFFRDPAWE